MTKNPWEIHRDLQAGRLQLVATVLRETRRGAITRHDAAAGDTPWGLGCTVYDRSTQMLIRAGETMWQDWFRVVKPPLEFVFSIGEVPVRYYSGDPSDPGGKHLKLCEPEMYQLDLLRREGAVELIWRVVVDPDITGDVSRVVLIGMTASGEIQSFYVIPDDGVVSFMPPLSPIKGSGPGVTLPPATVTLRTVQTKKDDDKGNI